MSDGCVDGAVDDRVMMGGSDTGTRTVGATDVDGIPPSRWIEGVDDGQSEPLGFDCSLGDRLAVVIVLSKDGAALGDELEPETDEVDGASVCTATVDSV